MSDSFSHGHTHRCYLCNAGISGSDPSLICDHCGRELTVEEYDAIMAAIQARRWKRAREIYENRKNKS